MRYQEHLFQQREGLLLAAARQLFQAQPWDRVTIAELAQQAGIGKGTVYMRISVNVTAHFANNVTGGFTRLRGV